MATGDSPGGQCNRNKEILRLGWESPKEPKPVSTCSMTMTNCHDDLSQSEEMLHTWDGEPPEHL